MKLTGGATLITSLQLANFIKFHVNTTVARLASYSVTLSKQSVNSDRLSIVNYQNVLLIMKLILYIYQLSINIDYNSSEFQLYGLKESHYNA